MKSLLLVPVLVGLLAPHDFFVSILTIRHTPTSQTLDLTWQMTAHDIEHALENVALLKLNTPCCRTCIPLDHTDPFTLLVAVVLSAQCTDKKVNEITPLLFAKARTPQQMVKLSVEEIQDIIRPCGLSPEEQGDPWAVTDHPGRARRRGTSAPWKPWRPCPAWATRPPAW
jgi:hypothetical protein